jgi:hypothetical protein
MPLKVGVVEIDVAVDVTDRADDDDTSMARLLEHAVQPEREGEVTELVGGELQLPTLGGAALRCGHDARVADQDVERTTPGADECPDRSLLRIAPVAGAALAESGGRVSGPSGAAVKLGIPRTTLYSKRQSMKIDKRRFSPILVQRIRTG